MVHKLRIERNLPPMDKADLRPYSDCEVWYAQRVSMHNSRTADSEEEQTS